MEAIRGIARQRDRHQPPDPLEDVILDHLQLSDWPALVNYVYTSDKASIASLLPLLESELITGNPFARQLFDQAAVQLADMVVDCALVLQLDTPDRAASGSVLQRIPYMQEKLRAQLEKRLVGSAINFQPVEANQAVVFNYQQLMT